MFDRHFDGKRVALAFAAQAGDVKQDHVTVPVTFFDEVRRIAPATTPLRLTA